MVSKFKFVVMLLLLSSCAHNLSQIIDTSKRIDISGVSVLPPQETNWHILTLSSFQLTLGKQGQQPGESYVTVASTYKLPDLTTEDDFLKKVSEGRASRPQTGRFESIKNDETLAQGRETLCMRYNTVSQDNAARVNGEKKVMILEMVGYHCQHPKNKHIGVNFEYSHRHYSGNNDPAIE
jgi:hypothetical protein